MLTSVKHDPQRFSLPREKIRPFEHFLANLDNQVLSGNIFQVCLQCDQLYVTTVGIFPGKVASESYKVVATLIQNYNALFVPVTNL